MTIPLPEPEVSVALQVLAKLHREVNALRAELVETQREIAQAKSDFDETQSAKMLEANENLVMAVLRAEALAETAASDLDDLAFASRRDALLRVAIDSAHVGEWEMDLASGAIHHSLRYDMCFGHEVHQHDWNVTTFLQRVHPDDRSDVEQTLNLATQTLTDWQAVCRVTWPDDSIHWISVRGGIFKDGPHPARLLGIITEVTRIKQAEEAHHQIELLALENQRMLEAGRLKSQFISNMSHELRTPLNAIIGFSDLLRMRTITPDSPKHQEFLGHIGSSARHLLHLINDVLDLSRIESGKFDFYPESVNLQTLIYELGDVLYTALHQGELDFEVDVAADLSMLFIDPRRLKQVIYNYLSNAIKFTPRGGRVTVRGLLEDEARFKLEVEDTGIGIAASELPRLFVDFQQLDGGYTKLYQGTGLGLALTRRLVQAQGGSVGVSSVLGVGSTFYAILDRVSNQVPT
jgi:signal transduction histidine kinase